MGKRKRRLTAAEKAEKKRRRELYTYIFVGGKQKRVRRRPMIDGMDADEFIRRNADPIWLHENEMWEYIEAEPSSTRNEYAFDPDDPNSVPDELVEGLAPDEFEPDWDESESAWDGSALFSDEEDLPF